MDQRPETFHWMFGKDLDQQTASRVTILNEVLVRAWQSQEENCPAFQHTCNSDLVGRVNRLWLLRLQNPSHHRKFRRELESHVSRVREELGLRSELQVISVRGSHPHRTAAQQDALHLVALPIHHCEMARRDLLPFRGGAVAHRARS